MTDLRRYPLRISIPRTETARSTLRFRHTAYLVEIDDCGKKYTRWRRFTNFIWLHGELLRRAQDGKLQRSEIPELPQKRVVGNMDPAFIERRRATLEEYLQKLARLPLVVKDDAVWAFLDAELVTAAVPRFLCRRTTSQKEVEDCLGTLRKVVAKQDNVFRFCNEVVMQELVAFAEAEAAEPEAPLAGPAYARNTHQLQQAMHLKLANRIQFCKILHELIKNESGIRTMVDHGMFGALVKMLARSVDENETADDALCEQYRIVCRLSKENLLALLEGSHGAALLNFCQEDGLSTLKRIAEGNVALHPICASLLWNALQNAGVVDVLVGITGDNSSSRPVLLLFGSLLKSEDLRARVLTSLCIARIVRHEGALGAEEVPYLLEAISNVAAEFDAAEKRAVEQTAKNNLDMSELSFSVSMTSRSSVQPRGSQFQNVNDSSDRGLAGAAESRSSLSSILAPMLPIERDALLVKQTKEICCAKDLPRLIPLLQLGDAGDIDEVVCLAVVILDNFVQIELAEERASFSDLQILIEPLQRIIEAEEEDDGSQAHERCEQIRMRAARILIRLELPNKDAAGEPPNIHTFVRRAKILEVLDRHSTMCQDKSKRHIEEANHQRHSHDQVIDTCGLTQELCISDARLAEFARELTVLEAKRRTLEQEERNSSQAIEEMQLCIERTGVKKACLKSEIDVISESIFEQAQLLAESNCEEVLAHCERSLEEISAQVAEKAAEKKAVEADIREKEERQREVEANFQECQRREAELAEVRDTAPAHLERVQASLQETQCRIQEMQEKSFDLEFAMRQGELELTRIQGTSAEAEAALQKTRQMTSKLEAVNGDCAKCRTDHKVSASERDWGSLWTLTDDGSIKPELSCGNTNPFPVELVSKRMRFDDVDVTLFCDMVHTLSSPPISGKANESTGLHVHIGKHPNFFTPLEIVKIVKSYLRYEQAINELLPVSRQKNPFCIDLREAIGKASGLGPHATEQELLQHVDKAAERVISISAAQKSAIAAGITGFTTKGELLPVLLGEGLVWSSKRSLALLDSSSTEGGGNAMRVEHWIAPGMVLRELRCGQELLWKEPGSADLVQLFASGVTDPPNPWDVLEKYEDHVQVSCLFTLPQEVPIERIDYWLLRSALGFVGRRSDRYCKLNLMRIHLPSEKATIEFRQFPGGNFTRALTIWGWVRFLGQFIAQSLATAGLPHHRGEGPADQAELKEFMQLSNESLLLAWYRDTLLHQRNPEALLDSMRSHWDDLWARFRAGVKKDEEQSLLETCTNWRNLFWATAGMKQHFAPEDDVWEHLHTSQHLVDRFMQRLYRALDQKLANYNSQLLAVEEVSRCTSLPTVVKIAVDLCGVLKTREEVRLIQSAIHETGGWGQCDADLLQRISSRGMLATQLLLDHMRNLLNLCERSAQQVPIPESCNTSAMDSPSGVLRLPALRGDVSAMECDTSTEGILEVAHQGHQSSSGGPVSVYFHATSEEAGEDEAKRLVNRLYKELCGLLAPRADEVQGLWKGLRDRGWCPERISALNLSMMNWHPFKDAPDAALGLT